MLIVSLLIVVICLMLWQHRFCKTRFKKMDLVLSKLGAARKHHRKATDSQFKRLESAFSGFRADSDASLTSFSSLVSELLFQRGMRILETTNPDRIGHLACEPDLWLKDRILHGADSKLCALVGCDESVANPHLLSYWRQYFPLTIPVSVWRGFLKSFPAIKIIHERPVDYHCGDGTADCYRIYREWGDRPPLLSLREDDRNFCQETLREWGLKEEDWFVCVHNRERGYAIVDDDVNDFRNSPIESLIPAMQEIVARGGWVIRMGDSAMTPLPALHRVIDYAHSPVRSARLDVALCASTKWFLGCSSGLCAVSTCFGVPVAIANHAPMSAQALTSRDIGMPKLLYSEREGRLLSFPEVLNSPVGNFRYADEFIAEGIKLLPNSAEDITGLAVEMMERAAGSCHYTKEDENLQRRYHNLIKPGHLGFGSAARTSRHFLRSHRNLLTVAD